MTITRSVRPSLRLGEDYGVYLVRTIEWAEISLCVIRVDRLGHGREGERELLGAREEVQGGPCMLLEGNCKFQAIPLVLRTEVYRSVEGGIGRCVSLPCMAEPILMVGTREKRLTTHFNLLQKS